MLPAPSLLHDGARRLPEPWGRISTGQIHLSLADTDQLPNLDELSLHLNNLALHCWTETLFPWERSQRRKKSGQEWAKKTYPTAHTIACLCIYKQCSLLFNERTPVTSYDNCSNKKSSPKDY